MEEIVGNGVGRLEATQRATPISARFRRPDEPKFDDNRNASPSLGNRKNQPAPLSRASASIGGSTTLPAASFLQYVHLAYFSKPACDRHLYRLIRAKGITNIVELGMGDGVRAERMIRVAQRGREASAVRYSGIDLFEARCPSSLPGLKLKDAHRLLKGTGARTQLIPGDPLSALSRVANELSGTELLVVRCDDDAESLERAWFYVPRMLTPDATVLLELVDPVRGNPFWQSLARIEVDRLAGAQSRRKAA